MDRFHTDQRVLVKQDEDGTTVNRHGRVWRILTDGERAWILLDAKGGGEGDEKVRAYPDDCEPSDQATRPERRAAMQESKEPAPTIDRFGKDHWSTFAYVETRIVDYRGEPSRACMRCHADRHPLLVGENGNGSRYPTELKGGATLAHHDDWDCCDDLAREGLLENIGTSVNPAFRLTAKGRIVASQLRTFKSKSGNFDDFTPDLTAASP